MFGYPDTYGLKSNGHCGHCNCGPHGHAVSEWGTFCLTCCRWAIYTGPPQLWGDGMGRDYSAISADLGSTWFMTARVTGESNDDQAERRPA